ncbi:MAG: hypothetical protein ACOYMF_15755, partial [Bacteroidales bacterium]
MEVMNKIWDNISKLLVHEFGFTRYHEITGLALQKKVKSSGLYEYHRYRGFTLWLKEIVESAIAIIMICFFVYGVIDLIFFRPFCYCEFQAFAKEALKFAGIALMADSLLLIAALISSPGIDETIDSISISLAGVFLLR